jgi:hypothetical protein
MSRRPYFPHRPASHHFGWRYFTPVVVVKKFFGTGDD